MLMTPMAFLIEAWMRLVEATRLDAADANRVRIRLLKAVDIIVIWPALNRITMRLRFADARAPIEAETSRVYIRCARMEAVCVRAAEAVLRK